MSETPLSNSPNFVNESYDEFKERYNGFGKSTYELIKNKMPKIFDRLKFYQDKHQSQDSYAEYIDPAVWFIIQLDPDIEVVVMGNKEIDHLQFGDYDKLDQQVLETIKIFTKI